MVTWICTGHFVISPNHHAENSEMRVGMDLDSTSAHHAQIRNFQLSWWVFESYFYVRLCVFTSLGMPGLRTPAWGTRRVPFQKNWMGSGFSIRRTSISPISKSNIHV